MIKETNDELLEPLVHNKKKNVVWSKQNVYLHFAVVFFESLADSIWTNALLSAWLFLLATSDASSNSPNSWVGGIEALQGFTFLVLALPVGYLADKYGRSPMCKIGGVGYILSTIFAFLVIYFQGNYNPKTEMALIAGFLTMYSIFGGIFSGPGQTLFAESVPKEQRKNYFVMLRTMKYSPRIVGPLVMILILSMYGDHWTFAELKLPFLVGIALELPVGFFALFLEDRNSFPEVEKQEDTAEDLSYKRSDKQFRLPFLNITLQQRSIPFILFLTDLLYATGSGMTTKFFPLMYMNELHFSPRIVQGLLILDTCLMILFSNLAGIISEHLGRVPTVVLYRMFAIFMLFLLVIFLHLETLPSFFLIPILLLRNPALNCISPLDESILMDNVPRNERARWTSLDSICGFGWCGSAFFGGILVDKYGYGATFLITAVVQTVACSVYLLLYPIVEEVKTPAEETSVLFETDDASHSQCGSSPRVHFSCT